MNVQHNNKLIKKSRSSRVTQLLAMCITLCCLWAPLGQANPLGGQIPKIPAFLPMAHTVPQTQASPIDGEWVINTIGKRIRIQGGRAYAVDSWLHMFVLEIKPLMVVIKDIQRVGPGQYRGADLPLVGEWNAQLGSDGTLTVSVASILGPVKYALMPVTQDDPRAFADEKSGNYNADSGRNGEDSDKNEEDSESDNEDEEYEEESDDEDNYDDEEEW